MLILKKSEVFPFNYRHSSKKRCFSTQLQWSVWKSPFPMHRSTHRLTELMPEPQGKVIKKSRHRDILLQAIIYLPWEPQRRKIQTYEGSCPQERKGTKNSELGKPLTSTLHFIICHLLSEVKPEIDATVTSLADWKFSLPTWEKHQGDIAVHSISYLDFWVAMLITVAPHWGRSLHTHRILHVLAILALILQMNEKTWSYW